ncbi:MAG: Thioredoxin [Candidatus Methanofastidiosum methylothiophilum]|uniref:Thioredoxin n=1 Tax=Candidatus Methanofastidiosum methylothiophilum TaxID=1705564 RepID=A0A150IQC2_9EURY|nr:MAG: Thioredoxin [Candidatus Methanofastidiosum methylthiophilus]NMC76835.1 hypothetical protein [Candidatus Methanofastidiosa archaeon]
MIRKKESKGSSTNKRVLIELLASSECSYCAPAADVVYRVASQYDNIEVAIVNIDSPEGISIAKKHGIMSIPAIIINGKTAFIGIPPADIILHDAIKKAM